MTTLVIGIILIVGGVAFAAFPFFRRPAPDDTPAVPRAPAGASPRAMRAESAPSPIAAELDELELDRAMGKLEEGDYQRLRAAIEARAHTTTPSATQSPAPVTPAPAGSTPDLDAEAERLIRDQRATVVSCGTCGPRPEPGARFCSHCGRAIGGCPACGATITQPGARFCDQCGTALVA